MASGKKNVTRKITPRPGQPPSPTDPFATDALAFDAVRTILMRDGVLAGLTFRGVADESGINRVQLHQNFGSKQGLVRAAIQHLINETKADRTRYRDLPFVRRRRAIFEQALAIPDITRLEALLAQDGDVEYEVFPEIAWTRENLERDVARGDLPPDADGLALHVLTAAIYMGYCVFRDAYARDTGIDPEELDDRVLRSFDYVLERALTRDA